MPELKDYAAKDLITVKTGATVRQAVSIMAENHISSLIVEQSGDPIGIITERDLMRAHSEMEEVFHDLGVEAVMSAPVITIGVGTEAHEAFNILTRNNIRHLVLTGEAGEAVGIISHSDLLNMLALDGWADHKTVAEIMSSDVVVCTPDALLRDAVWTMSEKSISCVAVVEEGEPVGMVSARDMVNLARNEGFGNKTLGEVMSSPVLTVSEDRYAFEASSILRENNIRRLLVVDSGGSLAGIVTQTDLVQGLMRRFVDLELMVWERTRDLKRAAEELAIANDRLRSLDELKTSFLASVSHELRTPLTSLLGFTKLIRRDFSTHFAPRATSGNMAKKCSRIKDNLGIVEREASRMTRLINDFLDLAKIEEGRMDWNDGEVFIPDLVNHAVAAVSGQFSTNPKVRLTTDLDRELPTVTADGDRLLQVLINLLGNACKFTEEGHVRVEARHIEDSLEISVEDSGVGIPAEELPRVFDKFHQVISGQPRKGSGTGLGLAICKEIVEHYHGHIWADSVHGQGSRFTMRLPSGNACTITAPEARTKTLDTDTPLVLVVDDNPGVCEYLAQLLEGQGYRVLTASSGNSALEKARTLFPDIITMDLMLPDMDGGAAIRELKADEATQNIPVVVLTAYPGRGDAGGDAAFTKPFNENKFLETVGGLLSGSRIQGRKFMLLPVEPCEDEGEFTIISAGRTIRCATENVWDCLSDKFEGTVLLPTSKNTKPEIERLSAIQDTIVVIMPEDGK